jgi:hypothetical protein
MYEDSEEEGADDLLSDDNKIFAIKEILNELVAGNIAGEPIPSRSTTGNGEKVSCLFKELFGDKLPWLTSFKKSSKWRNFLRDNDIELSVNTRNQIITMKNEYFSLIRSKRPRETLKQKNEYGSKYVAKMYSDWGLKGLVSQIDGIWQAHQQNQNQKVLRNLVFDVFIKEVLSSVNTALSKNELDLRCQAGYDKEIVNSIQSAVAELTRNERGEVKKSITDENRYALNILLRGSSYKSGLSKKKLASRLGVFERNPLLVSEKLPQEDPVSEDSVESGDNDDSNYEAEIEGYSGSDDSHHDSDSDDLSLDSDDEVEEEIRNTDSFLGMCKISRKNRSDARELSVAEDFWHSSCQINQNSSKDFAVLNISNPEKPHYEPHREMLQTVSTYELFKRFEHSQE